MPNKDGTGPCGKGAKTGKGKGYCGSKNLQSLENLENDETEQSKQGFCKGKGQGRGRCCGGKLD